jgi:hypothetical protein
VNSLIDIGAYEYVPDPLLSVANPIPDVHKDEDFNSFTIPLEAVFGYKYGSKFLSYRIDYTSADPFLNAEVRDQTLYLTSLPDKFGDQIVNVTASTGINEMSLPFAVHIAPIDDAPRFSIEGDLIVNEDFVGSKPYKITVTIPFGEENQTRAFALQPSTVDFVDIQFNSEGTFAFAAKPNLFGSQRFTLTMTEAQQTRSESFNFVVQSVNDPPAITVDNSPITIKVGEEIIVPIVLSDIEGDDVTLTALATNNFISLISSNTGINQYNIVITGKTASSSRVNLSASDGQSITDLTIPVTVKLVVGIEKEQVSYEAYPNPSIDYIVVNAKANSLIAIYNTSGYIVLQDKVISTDLTLSVRHLTPGLYFLYVDDGEKKRVFKIMKQ